MRIMVMDGQGGGVGRSLLEALKERFPEAELIAVGNQRHSYGEYDEERRDKRCHRGECRGI